ncbi:unnamed protein product [Staurois parvus]|uniref:Uncharacterized protein n=1 Tax=Staurois parvus TaxID=386267 RepID=A0ABN9BE39_9NEOB|nr:unnamed protein product [Staurois parvus]
MTLPPSCLTVGKTHLSLYSPDCCYTCLTPSEPNKFILVSSDHRTWFHNAAYGLRTDRLTPHLFNLCSNAGSTRMSIFQRQPLDMTLSTCTQLLWLTMVRPVLSGTCPVKPLYGLGHHAAVQFQGLGKLLIA